MERSKMKIEIVENFLNQVYGTKNKDFSYPFDRDSSVSWLKIYLTGQIRVFFGKKFMIDWLDPLIILDCNNFSPYKIQVWMIL